MKRSQLFLAVVAATTLGFASCKPKDADVKAAVDKKIAATPMLTGAVSDVKDGVATITGELQDPAAKSAVDTEIGAVEGVKSVVNSTTVAPPPPPPPPPPASMTTSLDEATQQKVKDGIKDIPGVTVTFTEDRAVLSGEVTKANRMKIMQMLAAAKVKFDPASKLTDKK